MTIRPTQRPSPLATRLPQPVAAVVAVLVGPIYALGLQARSALFNRGIGVARVGVPVISVGNLSLGGTGKTPMVELLARALLASGRRPAIAMRGYAGAGGASDEADQYRRVLPSVPVLVNADRHAAITAHLAQSGPARADVVLLDDGFQHRRLARQLDIVLLDASTDPLGDRLFPAGWLREPLSALGRAHAVVITHAEAVREAELHRLRDRLRADFPHLLIAIARHAWRDELACTPGPKLPLAWLNDRGIVASCGIGNPGPFLDQLKSRARVLATLVRPDHDPYSEAVVAELIALAQDRRAEAIVVTEKDWSKLARVSPGRWPCPVLRPGLELRIDGGPDELLAMVHKAIGTPA
jgi:tetraacyldisaccharide 4'-kinase